MTGDRINIKIKPLGILDLLAFKNLVPGRKKRIQKAPATVIGSLQPVNALACKLHPAVQHLIVGEVREETGDVRTYRLLPHKEKGTEQLAYFRPGQYLSFTFEVEGATVTRPYSISSSPQEALAGYYEITVKRSDGGFISNYIWNNWTVGSEVEAGGPEGQFYYDNLRDRRHIVGIAGGSGITPFRSMAKSILEGDLDISLTLFYGSNRKDEIIFKDDLAALQAASGGRIKVVHVLAEEKVEGFEHGFITAGLLKKYVDLDSCSIFICGPQAMYEHLDSELAKLEMRRKFIRKEVFGEIKNVERLSGYPAEAAGKNFKMLVHMGKRTVEIDAAAGESLLVALERAGLCPPSVCRSGSCGVCRSLLIKGDVFIPADVDGRRQADKKFGYIHPCVTFPLGNLEIVVPRRKVR
ncbi:MAG: iron-sulfur cluster-binding domain-containing protein [Firmicutes bacterium]|jgi:ferredoxin-NADP reductase|nr:iron-sulfur cluster-binding domain-containing protein [Bacillota bacterium]HPU01001.1 iron-sulfur cluster-binding domain-containing protein [Bacillota bacterium]